MKNVLFLCTGNSCRSQMAEGFAKAILGSMFNVYSAGTQKHGLNPRAIKVMAERGIDVSRHYSKTVEELPQVTFDYVITVCSDANENCPYFPGGKIIHQGFDDPPRLTEGIKDEEKILDVYRRVRDEIKKYIMELEQEYSQELESQ